jgi:hypothetical protein
MPSHPAVELRCRTHHGVLLLVPADAWSFGCTRIDGQDHLLGVMRFADIMRNVEIRAKE